MNEWICEECGTCYSSQLNEKPPGINWKDGHKCELVVLQSKEHKEYVLANVQYRALLDTLLPDDCNTHLAALQRKVDKYKRRHLGK
jgi:hypothetical protein